MKPVSHVRQVTRFVPLLYPHEMQFVIEHEIQVESVVF